jgi:hypothetical protein
MFRKFKWHVCHLEFILMIITFETIATSNPIQHRLVTVCSKFFCTYDMHTYASNYYGQSYRIGSSQWHIGGSPHNVSWSTHDAPWRRTLLSAPWCIVVKRSKRTLLTLSTMHCGQLKCIGKSLMHRGEMRPNFSTHDVSHATSRGIVELHMVSWSLCYDQVQQQ